MKNFNRQSNSIQREGVEEYTLRRNPLQRIAVLMNQYHSVDLMYGSKEDKEYTKQRIKNDIYKLMKYVSRDIHSSIKASFKSKDVWEMTRQSII